MSPATALAHEAFHAESFLDAVREDKVDEYIKNETADTSTGLSANEANAIEAENEAALLHGELSPGQVTRTTHKRGTADPVYVGGMSPEEISDVVKEANEKLLYKSTSLCSYHFYGLQ